SNSVKRLCIFLRRISGALRDLHSDERLPPSLLAPRSGRGTLWRSQHGGPRLKATAAARHLRAQVQDGGTVRSRRHAPFLQTQPPRAETHTLHRVNRLTPDPQPCEVMSPNLRWR